MKDYKKLLDPKLVSEIKNLNLRARLIVEGFLIGFHRSPFHGFSVEFKEHRPYSFGDEMRWVDWKVYARTDRFYVRRFEEETNLKAYILLDISKSMDYPQRGVTKFEYAVTLAGALTYLLLAQRDAVGMLLFSDRVDMYIPPRSSWGTLELILAELNRVKPRGRTEPQKIFREFAGRIKKKGLIILISDLLLNQNEIAKGLMNFRHKRHEVLVFHILSREEVDSPRGSALFEDMETGETLPFDYEGMREIYRRKVDEFMSSIRHKLLSNCIDYERVFTDTSFGKALFYYLEKRRRLF